MAKVYISGHNQTKAVNPSNIQQTIEPDSGYNALDAVVVNPIKALMPANLEKYILRDETIEPFTLSLSGDIPSYACYQQKILVAVYGTPTSIGSYAFSNCTFLASIDGENVTSIENSAFLSCTSLTCVDFRNTISTGNDSLRGCNHLKAVDFRNIATIGNATFRDIGATFNLLDITNTHSASLANSSIPNHANLTICVADETDKAYYQSATNWSTYASKIKTVAEFEQEIGMSYDNYYLQVFGHPRNEVQS